MSFSQTEPITLTTSWGFTGAFTPLAGTIIPTGIPSSASLGSPTLTTSITPTGIPSSSSVGTPRILAPLPSWLTHSVITSVTFGGVDYTHLVMLGEEKGIKRSMSITGGSKASCTLVLNNRKGFYRPPDGEEVVVWTRTGKWFAGVVDKITEKDYSGAAGLNEITVSCIDCGALCERLIVGRVVQAYLGNVASNVMYELKPYLSKLGITYSLGRGDIGISPTGLGDMVFNWVTLADAISDVARKSGGDWRVDFDKTLTLFYPFWGSGPAPFEIHDNDGNWIEMTVDKDSSQYRNRVGIKNSQNTKPLWTDTFVVGDIIAEPQLLWHTMAQMSTKPVVRVNGVLQSVISFFDIGRQTYDCYWIGDNLWFPADNRLVEGDIIEVTYPSPLSYTTWAEDPDEIAAHGLFEGIEETKDIPTLDGMQALADAVLTRRKNRPTTLNITTDKEGIEAGMLLTVDTTRPLASGDFLVTRVNSVEYGKSFFRHSITAVDAASQSLGDITAFYYAIVKQLQQPRDRQTQHMRFQVAETVEGFTNPGLTVGTKQAIITAPVDGYLRSCSLDTQNVTPVTSIVEIDVLQNGVSIFPVGGPRLTWDVGQSVRITVLDFLADPMPIKEGDRFTFEVIRANANFKDGTIDLAMLVA